VTRLLGVLFKNKLVGQLSQQKGGELSFVYDAGYLETASQGISISLPLQSKAFKGAPVKAVFSGLLPDESVKEKLAA